MGKIISMISSYKVQKNSLIIILAIALIFPVAFSSETYMLFLLCMFGIYIIVNSGLDILFGYSGQISLGHAGFYAIGAYVSAFMSISGVPVILSMIMGAVAAALVGYLLALPTVKLVHHFLALVTIGFGEIVRLLALNGGAVTGGADGINFIPELKIFGLSIGSYQYYFYFVLAVTIVFLVIKSKLVDSRVGRAFIAIRENPDASEAFGIRLSKYKALAFTISAFYAGFGGALYAHLIRFISPESFSGEQSIMFLVMILVGGMGTFIGPILGGGIIIMLTEFLQRFGNYQMAIYGILIILVLFVLPKGIIGTIKNKYYYYFAKTLPENEYKDR